MSFNANTLLGDKSYIRFNRSNCSPPQKNNNKQIKASPNKNTLIQSIVNFTEDGTFGGQVYMSASSPFVVAHINVANCKEERRLWSQCISDSSPSITLQHLFLPKKKLSSTLDGIHENLLDKSFHAWCCLRSGYRLRAGDRLADCCSQPEKKTNRTHEQINTSIYTNGNIILNIYRTRWWGRGHAIGKLYRRL